MKQISMISLVTLLLFAFSCNNKEVKTASSDSVLSENSSVSDTVGSTAEEEIDSLLHQEEMKEEKKEEKKEETPEDSTTYDSNYRYENTYIYISKPKMRLYILNKNDSVLFSCGIACGIRKGDKTSKGDYRTPEGHFRVVGIYESTNWVHKTRTGRKVKGCYGPYFLSLATGRFSGIGIHGTNAPHSIGKRASEGCIRVNTKNIIHIKEHYAYAGMPVVVSGEREYLPNFSGLGEESRDLNLQKHPEVDKKDTVSTGKDSIKSTSADSARHTEIKVSDKHESEPVKTEKGDSIAE